VRDGREVLGRVLYAWRLTRSLFGSGITTADNCQGFVPEDGNRTVTDGACTDAALPIDIFALETQALRTGTSSDDYGVGSFSLLVFLTLTPVSERTSGKVDTRNGFGDDGRAEPKRLCAELVHKFRTEDSARETRKVLDYGSSETSGTVGDKD